MVGRGATLGTALAVSGMGTAVAELILGWVVRARGATTAAAWLNGTSLDSDVRDGLNGATWASTRAAVFSEP